MHVPLSQRRRKHQRRRRISACSVLDLKSKMGYWDVPEGTDCVQKTWITTKIGTALGLVGSAYHIVAFQPDSALAAVQRATNATVTMAALGAIFGMTTCLSAQARDAPEDPVNYFIGGCASGVFLGARTRSVMTGTTACLGLGTLGFFLKVSKDEKWKIFGGPEL